MGAKINLKHVKGQPLFRISLLKGQEHADFRVMGKFSLKDGNGTDLIKKIDSDLKWRIKIKESKPGKENFYLVLYESFDKSLAEKKLDAVREIEKTATLKILGGEVHLENRKIGSNFKYIITVGDFSTEIEARKAFKRFQPDFIPYIEKEMIKEPSGLLEVFDAEYDRSAEVSNILRIVPEDMNTKIKIFSIRSYNDLLQKFNYTDLVYNGIIEFRFDAKGLLMAISEVPLEVYLKRVMFSEAGENLPLEFYKSLAIVARSEAISRVNHHHPGEPYDYSYTGEILRYYGIDYEDEAIDKAVELTGGQVFVSKERILDTPFHLICGGHTEDSEPFDKENKSQFSGKYDWHTVPKDFTSLTEEQMVKKWIHSRPDTWSNLKGRLLPPSLEKVKKYFRWEVNYSRRELEEIIRKKTGVDIGILFEIIPISRGRSGRLTELELIGSLKNYRIRGQLNIRETLSYDYLPSSCFLVERELDETGTPISFTFVGAGHGHGIGMCKTGAAVMAIENQKSNEILKHYFEKYRIESIYKLDLS